MLCRKNNQSLILIVYIVKLSLTNNTSTQVNLIDNKHLSLLLMLKLTLNAHL